MMHVVRFVPRAVASASRVLRPACAPAALRAISATVGVRSQSSSGGGAEPISTEPPAEDGASAAGGQSAGSAGADPVKKLEAEVAELKKKVKEVNDNRVYLLAEMENVRRIAKADVDKAKQYAAQPIAKALLVALDNLTMAVASIPGDKRQSDSAFNNLADGVDATLRIFSKTLSEHGTVQFGTVGEKFDPNRHEAVTMFPATAGQEPNTVAHVMKTGFLFKDRVIRPAQVAVFMKPQAAEEAQRATEKVAGESTRTL